MSHINYFNSPSASVTEQPCWNRAHRCPSSQSLLTSTSASTAAPLAAGTGTTSVSSTSGGVGTICEAWYRCDGLSNYVISWWCHGGSSSSGSGSGFSSAPLTSSILASSSYEYKPSAILQCDNSSASLRMDTDSCPPPVVCPGNTRNLNNNDVQVNKDNTVDVDIVLAIVLVLFAIMVLSVMAIIAYKYWKAKRRHRRYIHHHHHHHHRRDRPYRALPTTGYYSNNNKHGGSSWFTAWTGFPRHLKFVGKSGTVSGVRYADVYIPSNDQSDSLLHIQQQQQQRQQHQRASSTSTTNNIGTTTTTAIATTNNNHHHHHNQHHHRHNSHNKHQWGLYRTASRSPKPRSKVKRVGRLIPQSDRAVTSNGSFSLHHHGGISPRRTRRNSPKINNRDGKLVSNRRLNLYSPKEHARRWTAINNSRAQEMKISVSSSSTRSPPASFYYDRHGGGFYLKGHNVNDTKSTPVTPKPVCYYVSSPTPEYHSIMSSDNSSGSSHDNGNACAPSFKPRLAPVVSSIHIPSFEDLNKAENDNDNNNNNNNNHNVSRIPYTLSKKYNLLLSNTSYDAIKDPYLNYGYQGDDNNAYNATAHDGSDYDGSWRSTSSSSVSPYALGLVHCRRDSNHGVNGNCGMSEAASIASKNWQYTVFSQQQQQQQQQQQHIMQHQHLHHQQKSISNAANSIVHNKNTDIVRASSMKNSSNYFLNCYNYQNSTPPNSPDVVSSHNLSTRGNHVTRDNHSSSNCNNNNNNNNNGNIRHHPHHQHWPHQQNHHHHHQQRRDSVDNWQQQQQKQQQQHHHHHHHHHHHQMVQQEYVARISVPGNNNPGTPNQHRQHHQQQQRQQQQQPHDLNMTEINGGNVEIKKTMEDGRDDHYAIHRNYNQRVHIPGNVHDTWRSIGAAADGNGGSGAGCSGCSDECCCGAEGYGTSNKAPVVSQELSYDCFRNEHLRQLARQETIASASTLDKAVGRLSTNNIRVIPYHHY